MYVTLLLLAPVVCEWVEISQQHYRKPILSHHFQKLDKATEDYVEDVKNFRHNFRKPPRHDTSDIVEVTETYEETSRYRTPMRTQYLPTEIVTHAHTEDLSDASLYQYQQAIRPQHLTDKRSEETTNEMSNRFKTSPTHFPVLDKVTEDKGQHTKRNRIYLNQSISDTNLWTKGSVNKVTKHGNVQRVHLDKNTIKAPSLKTTTAGHHDNAENSNKNKNEIRFLSGIAIKETNEQTTPDKGRKDVHIERIKNYNDKDSGLKNDRNNNDIDNIGFKGTSDLTKDSRHSLNNPINNITLGNHGSFGFSQFNPSSLFITEKQTDYTTKYTTHKIENFDRKSNVPTSATSSTLSSREKLISGSYGDNNRPNPHNETQHMIYKPEIKTDKHTEEDHATVSEDSQEHSEEIEETAKSPNGSPLGLDTKEDQESNDPSNNSKENTMENLIALMKVVAETIKRNTRTSVSSKATYLTNLKDTILRNIKERIDTTWPDEIPEPSMPHSRTTRATHASARGHLEIPSSESALMTISFLTFAVFLIKLVLVIQTYKNKTLMMTPAIVATVGRTAGAAAFRKSNVDP